MKFELEKLYNCSTQDDSWVLKITRTEFLKNYNKNKEAFFEELNYAIEMLCAPNCFECALPKDTMQELVENFKTSYKAIMFDVAEDENGNCSLCMGYAK